ncbi:MAG: M20/M25/M40 family metallo-hydrolase [Acidimicrobiia bacterium]|nr:M20/M25/M40 family metallo-hydrolase [Acidimicrobiia bacterium]
MVDADVVNEVVDRHWDEALPVLEEYIRIPAKSPAFDPDWKAHGHLDRAVELVRAWCAAHAPADAVVSVHELPGRTPVVIVDVPASEPFERTDTALLYGHLDKQPEMTGWREGLGPWTPVIEDDRLFGRGGGDDGYSAFAIMAALDATVRAGGAHQRCVALIEASEESGSPDLPAHLDALGDILGDISLVICLDSGAPDYDALWLTTSLRGLISADLRVDVLERGMHSGIVGGAAPSSVRILRQLLDRIEDPVTGRVVLDELHVEVPSDRLVEIENAAMAGVDPRLDIAFAATTCSDATTPEQALRNICWEPAMATVGVDGIPPLADAGNVLRPHTTLGLSFRLPPTCDPEVAIAALRATLEVDPPSGATVTFTVKESAPGWNAPRTEPWLQEVLDEASSRHFGRSPGSWGIGGSIPFMAMLGERYPAAQFVITGVLGPESNAHGPNEFLDLPTARRVSACMSHVLDAHARRPVRPRRSGR